MISFSVLIPVYNVEKYIRECINSVLNQTYQNFEIIIIDDGSTDSSGRICDEYEKKDQRVKVYHQNNRGSLITRRIAISRAVGDYVLFLYADDYWEPELLESVNQVIYEYDCDMAIFKYIRVSEKGAYISESISLFNDKTIFTDENKHLIYKKIICGSSLNNLCLKAVKHSIIDIDYDYSIFSKIKNGEDLLQSLPLIYNARKIVYLDKPLYNYRIQPNSITQNINLHFIEDITIVREAVIEHMKKANMNSEENLKLLYEHYINSVLVYTYKLSISKTKIKNKIDILLKIKNIPLYINAVNYINVNNYALYKRISIYLLKNRFIKALIIYSIFMKNIKKVRDLFRVCAAKKL